MSGKSLITYPFLNTRFYMSDGTYSIDYYDDAGSPEYIETFRRAWIEFQEDPRHHIEGRLRSTAFYFTRCTNCTVAILTNRDRGASIACRSCDVRFTTSALTDRQLLSLLTEIDFVIGKTRNHKGSAVNVLLCQHPDKRVLAAAGRVCEKAGMSKVSETTPVTVWLLQEGIKQRALKRADPISVWQLSTEADPNSYEDMTPAVLERVIDDLRHKCKGILTISTSIDPGTSQGGAMLGTIADLAKIMHGASEAKGGHVSLSRAEMLLASGDIEAARRIAENLLSEDPGSARAHQLWGRIAVREQLWSLAIDYLQRAHRLDPTDKDTLVFLFACLRREGRMEEAARAYSSLALLGGSDLLGGHS